ncbi:MAG: hypothetical protein K2K27_04670, partial [Muribaculaceae bacterium]|nr:hypothetical protein [Muribaculaceae bacterium]
MKAITIRKNWIEEIEKLDQSLQPIAVWAVFQFVKNGEFETDNIEIQGLINFVARDLERIAVAREKARERREKLKQEKLLKQQSQAVDTQSVILERAETEDERKQRQEYEQHPELFMFDGFMAFICSNG